MVPMLIPFTRIEAPMILSPVASFTTPWHVPVCSTLRTPAPSISGKAWAAPTLNVEQSSKAPIGLNSLRMILLIKV